jgi:dienelactone hydrolase
MFGGRNSPIAQRSAAPFPIVGFATGWTCDVAMYEPILEHLASHGMVVVAPLFNDLANDPLRQVNFRSQLSQILSTVKYVSAQSSSAGVAFGDLTTTTMWHNRVDVSRLGLVGHSAGAGVVIQGAAEQGTRVKAVATLGAWVNVATTPWMASLANTVTAPVMLLSGQNDTMAPLATNAQRVFDSLTSPRVMPIISGGSHWCARLHAADAAHATHLSLCSPRSFLEWTAGSSVVPAAGLLPWFGYSGCPQAEVAALPPPIGRGACAAHTLRTRASTIALTRERALSQAASA